MALGDSHVVIDPITGQGANSASHAADVLCEAIGSADTFDRTFCERVEQQICSYVVPVSDASNARLQPPTPHVRQILGVATHDQAIANVYADGYNHPDRFWAIASSPERTAAFLNEFERQRSSATVASQTYRLERRVAVCALDPSVCRLPSAVCRLLSAACPERAARTRAASRRAPKAR